MSKSIKDFITLEEFEQERIIDAFNKQRGIRNSATKYLQEITLYTHYLSELQESCPHPRVVDNKCTDCQKEFNG